MKRLDRDPTLDTLRSLPRATASADFTERLLERLDESSPTAEPQASVLGSGRFKAAAAIIAVVGVILVLTLTTRQSPSTQLADRAAVIEELRLEKQRLAAELETLRAATEDVRPLVLVGGDDTHLLVLDLESIADENSEPAFEIRPAAYQPY